MPISKTGDTVFIASRMHTVRHPTTLIFPLIDSELVIETEINGINSSLQHPPAAAKGGRNRGLAPPLAVGQSLFTPADTLIITSHTAAVVMVIVVLTVMRIDTPIG